MDSIKFGPSGNCERFYLEGNKKTYEVPKWLATLGLYAFEYSFGLGITLKEEMAVKIASEAKKYGLEISVHAPYFINFASLDEELVEKSFNYIFRSLNYLQIFNGRHLVVHIASQGKLTRDVAYDLTKQRLIKFLEVFRKHELYDKGLYICLETMGKEAQIGTYQEIVDLCALDKMLVPTFDFGHINALTQGGLKTKDDFLKIFNYSILKLGFEKTKNCHIHFSKIQYGLKGEIKHLTFADEVYGPTFEPLAQAIKQLKLSPVIICESKGTQTNDALKMKNIYNEIV